MARKKSTISQTNDAPTHFSRAVTALATLKHLTVVETAVRCKLDPSTLHRAFKGHSPSDETLYRIIDALPSNDEERIRLIESHLLDQLDRARVSGRYSVSIVDSQSADFVNESASLSPSKLIMQTTLATLEDISHHAARVLAVTEREKTRLKTIVS